MSVRLPELDDDVKRFLDESPPLAFVTSTAGPRKQAFFQTAIDTCLQLGKRGILLGGSRKKHLPNHLPKTVRHFEFAPLLSLLPHCEAIVHRAGIGVSSFALAAGCPQLLLPVAFGQPDTANRLARLGVGQVARRLNATEWSAKIVKLLENSQTQKQCHRFAEAIRRSDPLTQIADHLERLGSDFGD